ncbi:MAG: YhcH/YjgK/YiaL family protein [Clostridia bacterium]|nr:YhcH/YjgK/YiaL family protein [Clostridia bacterium]
MIYDTLKNLSKYPSLVRVKKFLDKQNGTILDDGKYEIDENCYVAVSEYETGAGKDFEAHREYIDVQIVLRGREYIFVQDIKQGISTTEYDAQKDIIFYKSNDAKAYILDGSNFLVLDVDDLHKPGVAIDESMKVKKYVFKIKKGE